MDFDAACTLHRPAVLRYCTRVMQSREDGEDATQATLLNAWKAWERTTFDGDLGVKRWLYFIAHNACVSTLRRRHVDLPLSACLDAGPFDLEHEAEVHAECARVAGALGVLTPLQSRMLLLSLAGYGDTAIAAMVGIPKGTIASRIFRGRRKLRAALAA